MPISLLLFLFGFVFFCLEALAQSRLNPNSHNHGVANMTVLYESGQLLIELEAPADNMLGFEHRPQNSEQWQRLSQLNEVLSAPERIFKVQEDCKVQSIKVDLPFQKRVGDVSKQFAAHPRYAHGDNHKFHENHQDIHLSYEWQCNGRLPLIMKLPIFSLYRNVEKIQAQWVANGKQGAKILNKSHVLLEIE